MRHRPRIDAPKVSEADIQKTCTMLLELDGWRALRTDPVSRREWGKGFGELGMADHLYIRYGKSHEHPRPGSQFRLDEVMWIEFKRRGGKAKQHQKDWHASERARGALTLIAGEDFPASIEGFLGWYNQSGLARHKLSIGPLSKAPIRSPHDPAEQLGKVLSDCLAKCPK